MGWKTSGGTSGSDPTYLEPRVTAVEIRTNNMAKVPNRQTWIATEGQTDFTISNGTISNVKLLDVYIGGVPQDEITLVSPTVFRVSEALSAGMKVFAEWFEVEVPMGSTHKSTHEAGGIDEIDVTKLKGYDTIATQFTDGVYFHNITVEKLYDSLSNTDYILTTIPYKDEKGNVIEIKRGFAGDVPNGKMAETVRNFANRHNATVAINASVFDMVTNSLQGTQVNNGVVLSDGTISGRYVLGIKADNTFITYPAGTTGQEVITDGCIHAITSFIPLIQNGVRVSQSILDDYASGSGKYVRQVLAQYPNKDILIMTNDTGAGDNLGMTSDDCIRLLLAKGINFAYMLDGGGSAQTVLRGALLNRARDNEGYTERVVPDFLYFGKTISSSRDKEIVLTNEDLGELSKRVADLLLDVTNKTDMNKGYIALKGASNYISQGIESWQGSTKNTKLSLASNELNYYDYVNSKYLFRAYADGRLQTATGVIGNFFDNTIGTTDLNSITRSGFYWAVSTALNIPDTTTSWAIIHIQYNSMSAMQIAHSYTSPFPKKVRRLSSDIWSAWS